MNYFRAQIEIEHERVRMSSLYTGRPCTRRERKRAVRNTLRFADTMAAGDVRRLPLTSERDDRDVSRRLRKMYGVAVEPNEISAYKGDAVAKYDTVLSVAKLADKDSMMLVEYTKNPMLLYPQQDGVTRLDEYQLQIQLSRLLGKVDSVITDAYDANDLLTRAEAYERGENEDTVMKQVALYKRIGKSYLQQHPPLGGWLFGATACAEMYVKCKVSMLLHAWVWFDTSPHVNLTCTAAPLLDKDAMYHLVSNFKLFSIASTSTSGRSQSEQRALVGAIDRQVLQWFEAAHNRNMANQMRTKKLFGQYRLDPVVF